MPRAEEAGGTPGSVVREPAEVTDTEPTGAVLTDRGVTTETEATEESGSRVQAGPPDDAAGGAGELRHTSSPCLSPDGSALAHVLTDRTGHPRAVQRPLGPDGVADAGPERDVILPVEGPVRRVAYSPDGRWLACEVAPDAGERERIWLVNNDPGDRSAHPLPVADDVTEHIVDWDGDRLAVTTFDSDGLAEGRLVDPWTGEVEIVDRRMAGALVHALDGVALFRVGARGHRELLRIAPDGRWWPLLPTDTGSTTDAGEGLDAGGDGRPVRMVVRSGHASDRAGLREVLTADAGEVLDAGGDGRPVRMVVRSDHSSDRVGLREVRADASGTSSWPLAERRDADLDSFDVSLDRRVAALLWNVSGGLSEIEVLDLSGSRPRVLARPGLPDVVASAPTLTEDGGLLAVTVESLDQPPHVVIYDVRRQRWVGEPPARPGPAPELRTFTARD